MHLSAQTGRKQAEQSPQMTLAIDIRHCRRGGEQLQAKAAYRVPDKGWNRFLSMAQTQNSHQAAHRTTSGKCHKGRPTGRERRPLPPPPAKGPAKRPISQCRTADIAMQNGPYRKPERAILHTGPWRICRQGHRASIRPIPLTASAGSLNGRDRGCVCLLPRVD